jgi:hypothetical protein
MQKRFFFVCCLLEFVVNKKTRNEDFDNVSTEQAWNHWEDSTETNLSKGNRSICFYIEIAYHKNLYLTDTDSCLKR